MKKDKLYIPVGNTLLNINNITGLKEILPDKKDIIIHLKHQSLAFKGDKEHKYQPIIIELKEGIYNNLASQIKSKQSKYFDNKCIDIIKYSGGLPLIQIVQQKTAKTT